jgi:L-ascorbate metabolism protein UlaG (beta-lactamase superfamily)
MFAPGLKIEDLPEIDVVVISHAHYDHLDTDTLDRLPNREKITAIVPLGLGKYFTERNFGKVIEVDWYDDVELPSDSGSFKLTAYPAIHWSSRSLFDMNKTLWMSYGFSAGGHSVFHSGDTETHPYVFKQVGAHMAAHHGGCDLGLMSIGAYAPRKMMKGAHMTPEGGVQVGREIGCKSLVPMHWGTFILSLEPVSEPHTRFRKAAGAESLRMKIGETIGFESLDSSVYQATSK